jgi:hypothetical protein
MFVERVWFVIAVSERIVVPGRSLVGADQTRQGSIVGGKQERAPER